MSKLSLRLLWRTAIVAICFLMSCSFSYAQRLTLSTCISFIDSSYSDVTDFLQINGWEYKGIDSLFIPHAKEHNIITLWAINYDQSNKTAEKWIHCSKSKTTGKVTEFDITSSASEFQILIPRLKFLEFQKIESTEDNTGLSKFYKKGNVIVVLANEITADGNARYSITIYNQTTLFPK